MWHFHVRGARTTRCIWTSRKPTTAARSGCAVRWSTRTPNSSGSVDRGDDGYDYQFNAVAHADPLAAKLIDFPVVPGETRLISEIGLEDASAVPAELAFWMRCGDFTDTSLARPVLAYVSDWPVIGTLLKAVPSISQRDAHVRLQTGVVSHSIWFHRPFDVSGWLRVEVRGERLAGGRGFGTGAVYTQGGSLVASFAQESVIRPFV
jgi:acyl-CoA thioesterase II